MAYRRHYWERSAKRACKVLVDDGKKEERLVEEEQQDREDTSLLIYKLGRDMSITCLLRCSRSEYGRIASINRGFRSVISSGEIYKIRRQMGIIEHWVYFSCSLVEWDAFDPRSNHWMRLPVMTSNECFMSSDKESLGVGTELLVFGMETLSQIIYRYSLLDNKWSSGMQLNTPRFLFGSASVGGIAILAGGCNADGKLLRSAELYNSDTGKWVNLPRMNKARKLCSAVFVDGKFYVIGGMGPGYTALTCGEEYDMKTQTWREIPNMYPRRKEEEVRNAAVEAPPLIAVVNNVLYSADYTRCEVRRYDKATNSWVVLGQLPERVVSTDGWGVAFRACGDRILVLGGPRAYGGRYVEIYSWTPGEGGELKWKVLATRQLGHFVYNCAVMGC